MVNTVLFSLSASLEFVTALSYLFQFPLSMAYVPPLNNQNLIVTVYHILC